MLKFPANSSHGTARAASPELLEIGEGKGGRTAIRGGNNFGRKKEETVIPDNGEKKNNPEEADK